MNTPDMTTDNSTPDSISELDELLKTYDKPSAESEPVESLFPGDRVTPGGSRGDTVSKPSATPFITHDPAGSDTPIEYYVRGAKKGQPKPPRKNAPVKPTSIQASVLLSGALFITLIDNLMPMIFAGLNNWRSKIKIDSAKLQLTDKQRADLAPVADAVARELNINSNPVPLLLIALAGIYGGNMVMLRNEEERRMKNEAKKEHEKNQKLVNTAHNNGRFE